MKKGFGFTGYAVEYKKVLKCIENVGSLMIAEKEE